jgi:transcriptional regulator with XRE-family HTH domain
MRPIKAYLRDYLVSACLVNLSGRMTGSRLDEAASSMDETLAKRIGDTARAARRALGMTQADAAERVGISIEFYARIERGGTLPSVPTLVQLARGLGMSADMMLGLSNQAGQGLTGPVMQPPLAVPAESPEMRNLLRRIRRAKPRTLRLLSLVAAELER